MSAASDRARALLAAADLLPATDDTEEVIAARYLVGLLAALAGEVERLEKRDNPGAGWMTMERTDAEMMALTAEVARLRAALEGARLEEKPPGRTRLIDWLAVREHNDRIDVALRGAGRTP